MKLITLALVLGFLALNSVSAMTFDFSSMTLQEITELLNGNSVSCFNDIQNVLPLFKDFMSIGLQYVQRPTNPQPVLHMLAELLEATSSVQNDCGVAVGPISYRKTDYMQQYCIENIQEMMSIANMITGEPPLTSSIQNLNLFFNYISFAVNTCGGIY